MQKYFYKISELLIFFEVSRSFGGAMLWWCSMFKTKFGMQTKSAVILHYQKSFVLVLISSHSTSKHFLIRRLISNHPALLEMFLIYGFINSHPTFLEGKYNFFFWALQVLSWNIRKFCKFHSAKYKKSFF